MKIDMGCGVNKPEGYVGIDLLETADIRYDLREGIPLDDNSVEEVRVQGAEASHHERSRFRRAEGRWVYLDGEMVKPKPVVREEPKVGRNAPCPCGSGRKFKRCCGAS